MLFLQEFWFQKKLYKQIRYDMVWYEVKNHATL